MFCVNDTMKEKAKVQFFLYVDKQITVIINSKIRFNHRLACFFNFSADHKVEFCNFVPNFDQ